jgi:hypothetical protein
MLLDVNWVAGHVEGGDKPGQWSACDLLSAAV